MNPPLRERVIEPKRPTFSDSWHRVESLRPRLRAGVRALRRRFRGEPWHVLEDPLGAGQGGRAGSAGAYFRLNESAWRFVALLDGRRTVADAWRLTQDALGEDAPTQPEAVALLGQLGASNLLQGDMPEDTRAMFRRYKRRVSREVKASLASLLSIRLNLVDPDRFVTRLEPLVGRVFSAWGLIAWAALLLFGASHLVPRGPELARGAGSVLLGGNLIWLYLCFAGCKLLHELGHAVACKRFARLEGSRGEVHTAGVMLLVLMPSPFVDATSAWVIRSKWRRAAVGAAGMYVELALAAVAAVVWASTAEGTLAHALAYNVMFVAGVSTIVFNANPLMKYDGYFILADLLETPNLAQRAREQVFHWVRRFICGVRDTVAPSFTRAEAAWLGSYHLLSLAYRVVVFVGITLFVMDHWLLAGALVGVFLLVAQVLVPLGKLAGYLASDSALARTRSRAALTTLAAAALGLGFVALVPVPDRVRLTAVIEPGRDTIVHAPEDGFILSLPQPGAAITDRTPLVSLSNDTLTAEAHAARARVNAAEARERRASAEDPAAAREERERLALFTAAAVAAQTRVSALSIPAPHAGVWLPDPRAAAGAFIRRGEPLGRLIDASALTLRAAADQTTAARLAALGDTIVSTPAELRTLSAPDRSIPVTLAPPAPAGRTDLPHPALADINAGPIRTTPDSPIDHPTAAEPYFDVPVSLREDTPLPAAICGGRAVVRIDLPRSTLLQQALRAVKQTFQQRFGV